MAREGTIYVTHPQDGLTAIGPEDEIPEWAHEQVHERHFADGKPADESGDEPFDPAGHTVDEVNEYLADADEDEVARVLAAEGAEDGKQRAGILTGPHAPQA